MEHENFECFLAHPLTSKYLKHIVAFQLYLITFRVTVQLFLIVHTTHVNAHKTRKVSKYLFT